MQASSAIVRCTVIGSAKTSSSTFTGNGVVSSTTTCPGLLTCTVASGIHVPAAAAAERTYRCRPPPGPNHSRYTLIKVV
ncbi:hypothetical protein [Streptomyces sp. ID05-18]|uniref:hypothetical protein n=1 Tax=Streptomyces sp. ID05-18 TaxID=3028662 RepID=UPI0029AAD073|nr:hypothetical protein [Streptomyces sp. ID05-18]MDX3488333.1 hypothetical protein [Streptomyces sp. ID05-18]